MQVEREFRGAPERVLDLIGEHVDQLRDDLVSLALGIHGEPELAFAEHLAARRQTDLLRRERFTVSQPVAGMDTAFRAERGRGGPKVAFLSEYDALPDLGHACGHNLIAAASVGAGIALARSLEDTGSEGTVVVLGTPAEEGGGGKILMVESGVFADIDAALMFHPSTQSMAVRGATAAMGMKMVFAGRPAHAAGAPHKGINALDALINTFVNINALRQHLRDEARIHGIITDGGQAPNVVPERAEGHFIVRARSRAYLREVADKVKRCAEGAALAAGASVAFEEGLVYAERRNNPVLAGRFRRQMARWGEVIEPGDPQAGFGSSDVGNVSLVVPTIHPYVAITVDDIGGHSREFAEASASPRALEAMLKTACGLAATAADLYYDPDVAGSVRKSFEAAD